jgi:hypothetical protein
MSEKQFVWVIERGEYSAYRVVGVFSSEKNARQICALVNESSYGRDAKVVEWPLDPGIEALNSGHRRFHVQMDADGEQLHPVTEAVEETALEEYCEVWERSTAPAYYGKGLRDVLTCCVWAADEQHAVKIVNERRLMMLASGELK